MTRDEQRMLAGLQESWPTYPLEKLQSLYRSYTNPRYPRGEYVDARTALCAQMIRERGVQPAFNSRSIPNGQLPDNLPKGNNMRNTNWLNQPMPAMAPGAVPGQALPNVTPAQAVEAAQAALATAIEAKERADAAKALADNLQYLADLAVETSRLIHAVRYPTDGPQHFSKVKELKALATFLGAKFKAVNGADLYVVVVSQ